MYQTENSEQIDAKKKHIYNYNWIQNKHDATLFYYLFVLWSHEEQKNEEYVVFN